MKKRAGEDAAALPRLTVQDVRAAAKSFPINTGVGIDNVSPRALDRLSDNALAGLIGILHACEGEGEWGS